MGYRHILDFESSFRVIAPSLIETGDLDEIAESLLLVLEKEKIGYGLRFGHKVKRQPGSGMLSVVAVSASGLACPEDLPEPGCIRTSLGA